MFQVKVLYKKPPPPPTLITSQQNIEFSLNIVQFQVNSEQYKVLIQTKKLKYITTFSTMIYTKNFSGQSQPNNVAMKEIFYHAN